MFNIFKSGNGSINQNVDLTEGNNIVWFFNLPESRTVSLFVQRNDGYGPNVYTMRDDEYKNWQQFKAFRYLTDLSYENIDFFSNEVVLDRGLYHIVAELPRQEDYRDSSSHFTIRFDIVN